jgi:hypothetical protein
MRSRRLHALLLALATLVVVGTSPADAQVLVVAERDLSFGMLMPGVPTTVAAADVVRSAQLRVQGRGRYQVSFALPQELSAPGGQGIPVEWAAGDGLLAIRNMVRAFDPRETLDFRINPAQTEAQINLGARVTPSPGQQAGTYSATIVVMIVQTGN